MASLLSAWPICCLTMDPVLADTHNNRQPHLLTTPPSKQSQPHGQHAPSALLQASGTHMRMHAHSPSRAPLQLSAAIAPSACTNSMKAMRVECA